MFPDGLCPPGTLCYNNRSTNSGLFVAASGRPGAAFCRALRLLHHGQNRQSRISAATRRASPNGLQP